ncbi:MAG TPA: MFS transporter [Paenibacillaceae bacterium]
MREITAERRVGFVNVYAFSVSFQNAALMTIVVPEALLRLDYANHTTTLARLAAISSLIAMIVPPAAGIWSDRWRIRGIGRKAFLLAGGGLNVAGLLGMSVSPSLEVYTPFLLLAMVGGGVAIAGYQALWSESVPPETRGSAAGVRGAAVLLGNVAGLVFSGMMGERAVLAMAAVLAAGLLLTALQVHENAERRAPGAAGADQEQGVVVDLSRPPLGRSRDFIRVFWAQGFVSFGMMLLMTFVFYFFTDVLQVQNAARQTSYVAVLALGGAAFASLYIGRVSDRTVRRNLVAAASVPMAGAAVGFALLGEETWKEPVWLAILALFFGIGYGAYTSTGWALAIDKLPNPNNTARDLGFWEMATTLPTVLAPAVGGWVLSQYAHNLPLGYRILFILTGGAILAGGIAALRVGRPVRLPLGVLALRLIVALGLVAVLSCTCRLRVFGRIPGQKKSELIISNHLHDIDGMFIPPCLALRNPLRHPLCFVASKRLFEPGFLVTRAPGLLRLVNRLNLGGLFYMLGARPIENMPLSRPLISYAYDTLRLHGNLPAEEVFAEEALRRVGAPAGSKLKDLWSPRVLQAAQQSASLLDLREPYRSEFRARQRSVIRAQLEALEKEIRAGASLFMTPEGRLSDTGYVKRFRMALPRLQALAQARSLIGISYDPYARRRLSVYVRFAPWREEFDAFTQIRAVRPITVSQPLCDYLLEEKPERFTAEEAEHAVNVRLRQLPPGAFPVPELSGRRGLRRAVRRALREMVRQGVLARDGDAFRPGTVRTCRKFRNVPDMLLHLRNTYRDTLAALDELRRAEEEASPGAAECGSHLKS